MNRIFPGLIAVVIIMLFSVNSAFGQCGLPGTSPCPKKPKAVPTPVNPKPKKPKKLPAIVTKPQTRFIPRAPKIEMVKIPAGSFMMGSNNGSDEKPVHRVNINYEFYMGKYEVTQAQWKSVMGNNPSYFSNCGGNCPVEMVSWDDVKKFIQKLNNLQSDYEYRLPTEAEWEYASRAGTIEDNDIESLKAMAWGGYSDSGFDRISKTYPVGQKRPNKWGLYDIYGNVEEWVEDWYGKDYYAISPATDPKGPNTGSERVNRGGKWASPPITLPAAERNEYTPTMRSNYCGFRIVRN